MEVCIMPRLADAKFLNGVINEILRLHPPVPSGVFRDMPPEGVYIKDTFVPGHTTVRMPQWAMARGEFCTSFCDVCSQDLPSRHQTRTSTRTACPLSLNAGSPGPK